jgi:hypothetical protein
MCNIFESTMEHWIRLLPTKRLIGNICAIVAFFAFSNSCGAEPVDDLWQAAQLHRAKLVGYFAKRLETHKEIFDGDGKLKTNVDDIDAYKEHKDGKPIRARISHVSSNPTEKDLAFALNTVADNAGDSILKAKKYRVGGNEEIDGAPCQIYEFEGDEDGKGFSGQAWINVESGRPVRIDYSFDVASIPFVTKYQSSVFFGAAGFPVKVVADIGVSLFVKKMRFHTLQKLDDWQKQP